MEKEFHILSVGASIIDNAQKAKIAGLTGEEKKGDEEFWKNKLDNSNFMQNLILWVKENPKQASAELNTFLRKIEKTQPKSVAVYPISTKTKVGEICKKVLEEVLKEFGFEIFTGKEISGYFWEVSRYDKRFAQEEFKKDISAVLDSLIYLALKKKQEGYRVYFNPTGGFKAHVIACALAGFLTGCEVYYMHEEFKDVITLPLLFYLPKGREVELLKILSDKKPRSGKEFEDLRETFDEEIERLKVYGLVELEEENGGKPFRIKITNKGILIIKELEGE